MHPLGYSKGARVVLEAPQALPRDPDYRAGVRPVSTVHLDGAAVENEDVELGQHYGATIESICGRFINCYSPEDNKLTYYYPLKEGDRALGRTGIEHPAQAPINYNDVDATRELPKLAEDGTIDEDEYGDNHSGYLGTLAPNGQLLDNGVMDLVAAKIAQDEPPETPVQ